MRTKQFFSNRFPRLSLMLGVVRPRWTKEPHALEVDPLNEGHRQIATFLRALHLPGVDTDDEEAVKSEIEMGRTVMLGAGSALAFAISKALEGKGAFDPLFWWASYLLLAAVLTSWIALYLGTLVRRKRVDRKYSNFFDELHERVDAYNQRRPVNEPLYLLRRDAASNLENIPRDWNHVLRGASAVLAGVGLLLFLIVLQRSHHS